MENSNGIQPYLTLNNGVKCPTLGIGTWNAKSTDVYEAIKIAIDCGYRHIDTAYVYDNEQDIGRAINEKINSGTVDRENLFIVSKLWNTFHSPNSVQMALERTLDNLQLSYLDLYLIHWPMGFKESDEFFPRDKKQSIIFSDIDFIDTWHAMENLLTLGLVKSIGVSNFNHNQMKRLLAQCKIKPVINQIECHPYLTQLELCKYCKQQDIQIIAYSPLGSPGRPNAFTGEPILLSDKKLIAIGKRLERTPAQILIRFQIERNNGVIPKSTSPSRIQENFNVFDFHLSKSDMDILYNLNFNRRYVDMLSCVTHKEYPFTED